MKHKIEVRDIIHIIFTVLFTIFLINDFDKQKWLWCVIDAVILAYYVVNIVVAWERIFKPEKKDTRNWPDYDELS